MVCKNHLQHYTLDASKHLVDIKNAKAIGGVYTCPHCGTQMILKCGQKRQWHFAHRKNVDCDYNRYLHSLAEIKIQEWFNSSPEINIYLRVQHYSAFAEYDKLNGYKINFIDEA